MKPEELEALDALEQEATGGPWQTLVGNSWAGTVVVASEHGHPIAVVSTAPKDEQAQADAAYIAAVCTVYPYLAAALREAWVERDHYRDLSDVLGAANVRAEKAEAALDRVRALCATRRTGTRWSWSTGLRREDRDRLRVNAHWSLIDPSVGDVERLSAALLAALEDLDEVTVALDKVRAILQEMDAFYLAEEQETTLVQVSAVLDNVERLRAAIEGEA